MLKGGADSDNDSDEELVENEAVSDKYSSDEHSRRVSVNTRSGRSATRPQLFLVLIAQVGSTFYRVKKKRGNLFQE